MDLSIDVTLGSKYKSNSQIVRICTEKWAHENLYCPACPEDHLEKLPENVPAIDFRCGRCQNVYQLKSTRNLNNRIMDAAYSQMIAAIRSDLVPNLFILEYSSSWEVRNLLLVPSFFFTTSCIVARRPLSDRARRKGHVLCYIMLNRIPPEGKVWIISRGTSVKPDIVRRQFEQIRPVSELGTNLRGWTLDVLTIVHKIKKREFNLKDVYAFEEELSILHPNNKHVRPKIRQQLQILRDFGLLTFVERGVYRLRTIV